MKNIFWMSFLICSISVQLVNCLVCRNCVSPASCRYTKVVQCTNYAANVTSQYLATYHQNVLELNSSRFNCLALKYVYTKNTSVDYHLFACVHPDLDVCALQLKPEVSDWNRTRCIVCSGNNCNRNSSGKIGGALYMIVGTVCTLILCKTYG
ncbi:uncharacterized protein LOC6576590 [Drosophila mojavensis]|uniref:Uncharacterized protein, isoform C n=1 Tax=Drosophila mojavensis TaxID=7230 RepID=B4KFC1_DROMO|nr:uncharacterized protein LOC6576590 [Drosophila mojavensis]EDW12021.2 uncharacterized protein Dmoj_GI17458, isoform C [Drosophila mojavensis]